MRTTPWLPKELLPRRGSWVWHARDAVFAGVSVAIALILIWRPPDWVLAIASVSSALLVGGYEAIKGWRALSKWRARQNAYYRTPMWQARRREILRRDNYECRHCGGRADDVHHLSYSADHDEPDGQLVSLCRECHEETHGRRFDSAVG